MSRPMGNPFMRAMLRLRRPRARAVILRHGSTDRNRGGVGMDQIRGHADVPMTQGGEREVMVTAYALADVAFDVIYTSDMSRAVRTTELIAAEQPDPGPVVVTARELRSWDMGAAMEGQVTTPDVIERIVGWVENDTSVPPGGESFKAFCARVLGFVEPLFEAAAREGSVIGIVSHGRTCQVIDLWVAAGCDEACMHRDFADLLAEEPDTVPPGGGVAYRYDGVWWEGFVVPTGAASVGTRLADRRGVIAGRRA